MLETEKVRVTLRDLGVESRRSLTQSTGMREFDEVLGGGLTNGGVVLLAGEPGIGKSTLVSQIVLKGLIKNVKNKRIVYVSGEEHPSQIRERLIRLAEGEKNLDLVADSVVFVSTTVAEQAMMLITQEHPSLVILDSVQTMQSETLSGMAGSVGQLREVAHLFTQLAKELQVPTLLIGHVTKEGSIAGPKVLEHIVDTVLSIEGDRTTNLRMLKCHKHRFGPTDRVGLFEMTKKGLEEIADPHALFVDEDLSSNSPGAAVATVLEGNRVLLVEVQALVVESQLAMPRRVCRGINVPKLQLLAAILQKHCGLALGGVDIFVNVVGGYHLDDPAGDLAIAMAIASSYLNKPLPSDRVYAGEIGLLGEVRMVSRVKDRELEAKKRSYSELVGTGSARVKWIRTLVQALKK